MTSKTIYHNHHIIPRHAGGTDDASNIVRLTVEEHAEAHRILYEEHGRWQDLIAYRALSGTIGKEEIIKQTISNTHKGVPKTLEHKQKISSALKEYERTDSHNKKIGLSHRGKTLSESHKEKIRIAMMGNTNTKGMLPKNAISVNSPDGQSFTSITEAAKHLNMSVSTFRYKFIRTGIWTIQ